jgi:four helix bundle protein
MSLARRKATLHAHEVRISRRAKRGYITLAQQAYHESQRLSISRRQRRPYHSASADKGVFMAKTSHELAIEFTVEITELCSKIKGRPEYTKQLIRSASSISANIAEAKYAESDADFVHKLEIAQKEANETETWLSVLCKSGIIDEVSFKSLRNKCGKIRRMLIASITTVKSKSNGQK